MRKIHLDFQGYWRDAHKTSLPNLPGIFCVYSCTYNPETRAVRPSRLLYVGQSVSVGDRLKSHERRDEWLSQLNKDEELCFTFASIISDRERAEAALIYYHKPAVNQEHKEAFPFEDTEMLLSGRIALLNASFATAERSGKEDARVYYLMK